MYPVLLKDGTNIGYVQLVPIKGEYEVGYHIGKLYTRNGYATEAVKAFLEHMMVYKHLVKLLDYLVGEVMILEIILVQQEQVV